jgi:hypothetical protein
VRRRSRRQPRLGHAIDEERQTRGSSASPSRSSPPDPHAPRNNLRPMLFYGVVSAAIEKVIEFFPDREQAEAFIAEVAEDDPEMAALLSVTALEFEQAPN